MVKESEHPCDEYCAAHAATVAMNELQEKRIDKLEKVVEEIPRMQSRVNTLMSIIIATMIALISISSFSFLQLLDFKKTYFEDRQILSHQTLEQERRYIDLINKLSERITSLEKAESYKK